MTLKCPKCRARMHGEKGHEYCRKCGFKVSQQEGHAATNPCPNCGSPLTQRVVGKTYECTVCGKRWNKE